MRRGAVSIREATLRVSKIAQLMTAGVMLAAASPPTAHAEVVIASSSPLTGSQGWLGEQHQRGAEMAVGDLNASGGVLGRPVRLIVGDDFSDPEQAKALAQKLASEGVVFCVGPAASEAAIAVAPLFEQAKIIMINPSASNPRLTEEGWPHVFRVFGRDDHQGTVAADLLARRWGDRRIAILQDGTVYGRGLADLTRARLAERGVSEALYRGYAPGKSDYTDLVSELQAARIEVVYVGGRVSEVALILAQAAGRGFRPQFVSGDAIGSTDFRLIAGEAGDGTLFTSGPDARRDVAAADVVQRFRASNYEPEGYTLHAYAAVQVWAQAVERAGTLDYQAVIEALHAHRFDTVLGRIGFDDKGDVTGVDPFVWYVWQGDTYVPADPAAPTR